MSDPNKRPSQKQRVLRRLQEAGSRGVRTNEFLAEHLPRFGARIYELRQEGYLITKTPDSKSESGAVYTLAGRSLLPRTARKRQHQPTLEERLVKQAQRAGDGARAVVLIRSDPVSPYTRVTIQVAPEGALPSPDHVWIGQTIEEALEYAERTPR